MSEEPTRALTPAADEEQGAPTPALLELYRKLPGNVVAIIEYERKAITRDVLDHLRHIRDELAPFGGFKEWCLALGLNYGSVSNRLSRADKPPVNEPLTDLLLAAGHEPVTKDSIAWHVLACGVGLRAVRNTWTLGDFEALCWVLSWVTLRHDDLPADDAHVARVARVLAWSVGEADAAQIDDYTALQWALTAELEQDIIRRIDRVPPLAYDM
jgi:hypothetical protein